MLYLININLQNNNITTKRRTKVSIKEEEYCVEVSGIFYVMDTSQENANNFIADNIERYCHSDLLYIGEETDDLFEQFINSLNLKDESDYKLAKRMEQFRNSVEFDEENADKYQAITNNNADYFEQTDNT